MKKALLFNRRIVRESTSLMFMLGCVLTLIIGVTILSGTTARIDLVEYPRWSGYVFYIASTLLFFSYVIDFTYRCLSPAKKLFKKRNTLSRRVERLSEELSSDRTGAHKGGHVNVL